MAMRLEYFEEPKLQFGAFFEHEDTKTGLAEFGPFGKNIEGLHASEVKLGFIGTRETIAGAQEWVTRCGNFIESEKIEDIPDPLAGLGASLPGVLNESPTLRRVYKILNRDFVGFNKSTPFEASFQLNPRWERSIEPRELDSVLKLPEKSQRILKCE